MTPSKQRGVALIAAIFLIVIVGAAVVLLAQLSLRNSQQTTQSLLHFRAEQAVNAAQEYAVQALVLGSDCGSIASSNIAIPDYSGFTVQLSCTTQTYNRPSQLVTLINITTTAEYGTKGKADYTWTELNSTIEL